MQRVSTKRFIVRGTHLEGGGPFKCHDEDWGPGGWGDYLNAFAPPPWRWLPSREVGEIDRVPTGDHVREWRANFAVKIGVEEVCVL